MFQSRRSCSRSPRQARKRAHFRHLRVELLEDRRLLAVVVVDTKLDVVDFHDGATSLREAIFAANTVPGPDEIVFHFRRHGASTILLDQGELQITEQLTITGPGSDLLTIDAQQQSRIFDITARRGDFTLAGMTLTGGKTTGDNTGGDNTFSGGAIRSLTVGSLTIENCVVIGNSTTGESGGPFVGDGGGLFAAGEVAVASSTISGNSAAGSGGGIAGGNVAITSSTISGNAAAGIGGGGISAWENVTVTSSTISDNAVAGGHYLFSKGGGILGHNVTVTSSTISGNSTTGEGGGLFAVGEGAVASSTISGNAATIGGGGVFALDNIRVTSSTISDNAAAGSGGGIWADDDDAVTIKNSIVARNSAGGTSPDLCPGTGTLTVQHSLIGDNTGTGLREGPDANDNLIGGPRGGVIDPMLGPLADNGSLTFTHALLPGSPAIDAGDPLAVAGVNDVPEFDQRGAPYTRVTEGRIDMGAHERHSLNVDILDVSSPTITPLEEVLIEFSGPVTGLGLGDLELLLNGGENLLTDSQNLSTINSQTFVLGGLAEVTTGSGFYTLRLVSARSGIVDVNGGPLDAGASISWAMGRSKLGLTVDTLVDESDGRIDDGDVSLRDAIAAAAPGETIDFDPSLDGGTILLTLGQLSLTRPLTIDATALASGLVIDAAGNDPTPDVDDGLGSRIFEIDDGNALGDSPVTIRGLTLTGGDVNDNGGAIYSREELTVTSSTILGNSAIGRGGGIAGGNVTVSSSTISDNSARGDYVGHGGGIDGEHVTVSSSTISGNSGVGWECFGGGIHAWDVTITSSTILGNAADFGGGISYHWGGADTVKNSIVARNPAAGTTSDLSFCSDTLVVQYSLIGRNCTGLTEAPVGSPDVNGNLVGGPVHGLIDPLLGPLIDNGGLTRTHVLLPGSPAIDAGDPSALAGLDGVPLYDQRGEAFDRVVGGRIDLGAFEVQVLAAGDANGDRQFDQRDIVQLLQGGKYNTGKPASWIEGDWTADGVFDQEDILAALATGNYLQGSYALRDVDATFAAIGG